MNSDTPFTKTGVKDTNWIDTPLQNDEVEEFIKVIELYKANEIPKSYYMLWIRRSFLPYKIESEPGNEWLSRHTYNCRKYGAACWLSKIEIEHILEKEKNNE